MCVKDWHCEKEKAIAHVVFVLEFLFVVVLRCDFIMKVYALKQTKGTVTPQC